MSPSNTVDKARSLIEERLAELDEERKGLEAALRGLSGGRRGPGRPRGSTNSSGRRRRRRKGGTRGEQAVKIITEEPGINPSQIAERLGIKPNYLYRVMNELRKDGQVVKRGRGYFPADA
jgi:DNA invertase Pin-like site-specific DNA recombinase